MLRAQYLENSWRCYLVTIAIGRVSNVTLCHEVPNFLFSGEVSCFICLINLLEGLLVRSYYSVCTSCMSFINAFRHCTVLQRTA